MPKVSAVKFWECKRNQSEKIKIDFLIRGNKERMAIISASIFTCFLLAVHLTVT